MKSFEKGEIIDIIPTDYSNLIRITTKSLSQFDFLFKKHKWEYEALWQNII